MGVKDTFLGRLLASSDKFSDEQVAQTISLLVEHGVKHHATDIHIEPHERFVQIRYRIDNVLRGTHKLPLAALPAVITKIKELAHLHAAEDHLPQEGQYATLVGEDQFEIQVYTMPVVGGEKVVLHIAKRLNTPPSLEALGFWGSSLQAAQAALAHTHGLILVAAPRRNGQTTTLHSLLRLLNTPAVSIATVEQSIEYRPPGVSQTQARPARGISFYTGMQAALNQDPNILMTSTLPDSAATNLAVQAAIGGHLILAGIHEDNAAKAIAHVQTANNEPYLLAAALRASISQRLVRKLCPSCRVAYKPAREEILELEKAFGLTAASRSKVHTLERDAVNESIGGSSDMATTASGIALLWRPSENGCESCNHTGYRGSIAIVEVLSSDDTLQNAVVSRAPANKLRSVALKAGFVPMELDGLIKALRGVTTISEVLRVLASV